MFGKRKNKGAGFTLTVEVAAVCSGCFESAIKMTAWLAHEHPFCLLKEMIARSVLELAQCLHDHDFKRMLDSFGHRLLLAFSHVAQEVENYEICQEIQHLLKQRMKTTGEKLPLTFDEVLAEVSQNHL